MSAISFKTSAGIAGAGAAASTAGAAGCSAAGAAGGSSAATGKINNAKPNRLAAPNNNLIESSDLAPNRVGVPP